MKIYDISQEVLSCAVFPGDPAPQSIQLFSIKEGDLCNLTAFTMCSHNGTHVDAPSHFIDDGKTVDMIPTDIFVGYCYVTRYNKDIDADDAKRILETARENGALERILIAGKATVTEQAAEIFAKEGIKLIGNESQTVGPENAPARVHEILLGKGIVLLEGIRLDGIGEGRYILSAAPLNFKNFEGAPCRAVLIEL